MICLATALTIGIDTKRVVFKRVLHLLSLETRHFCAQAILVYDTQSA